MGGYSSTATAPTFSPASLASQIDSAIAAVQRDRRGALLISADMSKASAALLVKCGPVDLVARVVKPYSGPIQADLSARIDFLVSPTEQELAAERMGLRDIYQVFRHCGNSRFWSLLKAVTVKCGASVPLLPADTVL